VVAHRRPDLVDALRWTDLASISHRSETGRWTSHVGVTSLPQAVPGFHTVCPGEHRAGEPWAALLPALDPTTMGWSERDWYVGLELGPHASPSGSLASGSRRGSLLTLSKAAAAAPMSAGSRDEPGGLDQARWHVVRQRR